MPKLTPDHIAGTVKWFDDLKGYGFVTPDDTDRPEAFLHGSKLPGSGRKTIEDGARVRYIETPTDKGFEATSIIVEPSNPFITGGAL